MPISPFQPGLLGRLDEPPRKVAVLRASRIGDFLCALPFFRALRQALPKAEITLITLPMLAELAARLPYFDRRVPFPGFPGIAEQLFDARRFSAFLLAMQAERFDLAIQLQGSGVYSNPFTLLLGARRTAGFIRPGHPAGLLDAALPLPEQGHEVQRLLAMAEFLGLPAGDPSTGFPLLPEDHAAAQRLLGAAHVPLIGLHASARDRTRRWPAERFAAAGAALARRFGGALVLLGEREEPPFARLFDGLGLPVLDLAGQTSLPVLGAVIARLSVLLTNDTGPAHIGYALNTPTVTIFGSADPQRYGPPQPGPFRILVHPVDCRPCGLDVCPIGYPCLLHIPVQAVVDAASQLIHKE